jgi:hypothetical protein
LPKAELASVNRAIDAIQKALASKSG